MPLKKMFLKTKVVRNSQDATKVKFMGYTGDAVKLDDYGFDHPGVYDLETLRIANQRMPLNYNHRTKVGETTKIENTKQTIRGVGSITETNNAAKRISNADFNMEASMGIDASEIQVVFMKDGMKANGQTFEGPHYLIKNALLDEMTITESGRDSMTKVHKLSRMELSNIKNSKPAIKAKTPTPINININNSTPRKKVASAAPAAKPKQQLSYSQLRRLENQFPDYQETILDAVDAGWSYSRIENAVKLAAAEDGLPRPPRLSNVSDGVDELEARLVATLCKDPEKTLEREYGAETRDRLCNSEQLGLRELLVLGAERLGGNYSGFSDVGNLVDFVGRANAGRLNNTGFSTFSMPNLFKRVTEVVLEESWKISEFFAPEKCFVTSHSDFKETKRIRPSGGTMWEGLDSQGRVKHGSFGEEHTYSAKLDTKAQMLGFSREMIENDDMGAIGELLDLMVEGALVIPDVKLVNHMLQDTGSFFRTTASGVQGINDYTGSGNYALSESALDIAYTAARSQTINKGRIDWMNKITDRWALVIPPSLEKAAWKLIKQDKLIGPVDTTLQTGDKNYWFNKLDIWVFNQLENTSINAKATSDMWFLWPQQRKYAPWAISYLKGRKRPTIRVLDAPVDMLGFVVVGYYDVNINDRESEAVIRMRPTGFGND